MMRRRSTEHPQELPLRDPLGQHRHKQRDRRHPGEEQQQLLEPHPAAVLLVALQQKIHRGPLHAFVPHHVDQVDQHGHKGEQEAPR